MKRVNSFFIVAGAVFCVTTLASTAAEPNFGQREYRMRCAMCHGAAARGDGWMAEYLIKRPPTLRDLKKKNGGMFPREQVARIVDGRTAVKGHGPSEMPAWGVVYKSEIEVAAGQRRGVREEDEINVSYHIQALIEYLATLQD
jgi:mono/diheme cytochrome c family protein